MIKTTLKKVRQAIIKAYWRGFCTGSLVAITIVAISLTIIYLWVK
jgi:hypothetical protein